MIKFLITLALGACGGIYLNNNKHTSFVIEALVSSDPRSDQVYMELDNDYCIVEFHTSEVFRNSDLSKAELEKLLEALLRKNLLIDSEFDWSQAHYANRLNQHP
jgi:hypothetical protein